MILIFLLWILIGAGMLARVLADEERRENFWSLPLFDRWGHVFVFLLLWPLLLIPVDGER